MNLKSFAIKKFIIPVIAALCIIGLFIHGRIPQDASYHDFIDNRMWFDIPNFLNVISNLPFALVGIWGIAVAKNISDKEDRWINYTLFAGFFLLTFCSSYYHLWPNNETLVYDRLSMVIIFGSFFAFIIYKRINPSSGYKALFVFNIIGILTVIYWIITERAGSGDLRWYGMVQFFPIVAIPFILFLYKSSYNLIKEIVLIFGFFVLAKFAENYDKQIYTLTEDFVSGHTIKHLLMA